MKNDRMKQIVSGILAAADIDIDGQRPWDIQVKNDAVYRRVLSEGSLGLGEAYMDGWWDARQLDVFFHRLLSSPNVSSVSMNWKTRVEILGHILVNRQRKSKALEVGERHYDTGNDLFEVMLDRRMVYSCAYWPGCDTLDDAQEAKLDLICRKLELQSGMTLLDIGCGWSSLAKFAAEKYGVSVVGVNNSVEQTALGRTRCAGLPVEIEVRDYRDIEGRYDRIVSVGMFEHVGPRNYDHFMAVVERSLKDGGLFLLHTIGANKPLKGADPFVEKYIFPGGVLPSIAQIATAIEGRFVMEDWHNLSVNYDRTIMAWFQNFDSGWDQLKDRYGQRFYRMWTYYLNSFAGSFRARRNQVWQIVLSKRGVPGGYHPLR